jgi:hypothetical protein
VQQLLDRLTWGNLSVQGKVRAIFVGQMVGIGLIALATFVVIGAIRFQLQQTVSTAVEMRALTQDMRLAVETMEGLESRRAGRDGVGKLRSCEPVIQRAVGAGNGGRN